MSRWPRSVRHRLTLWYSLASGLGLVAFAVVSLSVFDAKLSSHSDHLLQQASDLFVNELHVEYGELRDPVRALAATIREVAFREISVTALDARGRVIIAAGDARWPAPATRATPAAETLVSIPDSAGGYRGLVRGVRLGGDELTLGFLQPRRSHREAVRDLLLAFGVAIPLFLLGSGVGGYVLARRALAPIDDMARRARRIGASNLHERLTHQERDDEVGSLAAVINDLLARLERSFDLQRRFTADASHELRTAVTIVRAESEIALRRARSPDEYHEALRVTHEAGLRLSLIVDDLLLLARADAGARVVQAEPLHLDGLVRSAVRAMCAPARERGITLVTSELPEALVEGDPELLRRLLLNLLDNAIKYGRSCSTVRVTLGAAPAGWEIRVLDEGAGIPPASRDAIFERFYRVERARARDGTTTTSGTGLGLAIARWVAEAHGGTLTLADSSERGSEFVAVIPALPSA